jgi:hypothetical protein
MVVKVKLADGTTYDASKQLKELTTFLSKFLDKFEDEIAKEEIESQQQRVRDFVATLFSNPIPQQRATEKSTARFLNRGRSYEKGVTRLLTPFPSKLFRAAEPTLNFRSGS